MSNATNVELGVVGAGNMAAAILRGVIDSGVLAPEAIVAYDPDEHRRRFVRDELGLRCAEGNDEAAACPCILLAVKPFVVDAVLAEIAPFVSSETLLVSIAAGVTSGRMDRQLGGKARIVRTMPNTPMLVGAGASAVAAGPRATDRDMDWVRRLLGASGDVVVVEESLMDAVTAVSGSGPAYFFYLVEALVEAGVELGLDAGTAARLAGQTCLGAGRLLAETGKTAQELRHMVTTPGGTTEAAITYLEDREVRETMAAAVGRAAARSKALGA